MDPGHLREVKEIEIAQLHLRYAHTRIEWPERVTLKPEQINAFFKLMGERYGKKSTILTTNLDYPEWYDLFQRKALVDALLDRLKHHCITIRINGPSLRITSNGKGKPNTKS